MTTIERAAGIWRQVLETITPSKAAWRGATIGVYLLGAMLLFAYFASYFMQKFTLQKLPAFVVQIGALFLLGALGVLALRLIGHISRQ